MLSAQKVRHPESLTAHDNSARVTTSSGNFCLSDYRFESVVPQIWLPKEVVSRLTVTWNALLRSIWLLPITRNHIVYVFLRSLECAFVTASWHSDSSDRVVMTCFFRDETSSEKDGKDVQWMCSDMSRRFSSPSSSSPSSSSIWSSFSSHEWWQLSKARTSKSQMVVARFCSLRSFVIAFSSFRFVAFPFPTIEPQCLELLQCHRRVTCPFSSRRSVLH